MAGPTHRAMGRLDRALDEAPRLGWVLVSMRGGWRQVFAPVEVR